MWTGIYDKKNPNFSGLLVQSMLNFRRVYQTKNIEARDQFWEFFLKRCVIFFIDNSVKQELSLIFYFNIYKLMPLTSIGWLQKSDVCI